MDGVKSQDGPDGVSKKWATGRVLTKTQRERKRATDRITKRKRKDEAESRFGGLELQVQDLSCQIEALKSNASGGFYPGAIYTSPDGGCQDSVLSSAPKTGGAPVTPPLVPPQAVDNTLLVNRRTVAGDGTGKVKARTKTSPRCTSPSQWTLMTPDASISDEDWLHSRPLRERPLPQLPPEGTMRREFGESEVETHLATRDESTSSTVWGFAFLEISIRNHLCSLLRQTQELDSRSVCKSETLNQDALIRGITQGWDVVVAIPEACPLWKILESIDSYILRDAGILTRLCLLRLVHLALQYSVQTIPGSRLPPWFRPRPSQYHVPHALAINVLPWPGLRERAVFNEHLTASDKFWTDFISLIRLDWPYALSDAMWFQSESRLWQFTGLFEQYMGDIRRWEIDPAFFTAFPETFDDIMS